MDKYPGLETQNQPQLISGITEISQGCQHPGDTQVGAAACVGI